MKDKTMRIHLVWTVGNENSMHEVFTPATQDTSSMETARENQK